MTNPLARSAIVGIAGAGTMGAGIAEVAVLAGHPVRLFDAAPGAAEAAKTRVARSLAARAGRGKSAESESEAAARRLTVVGALSDLAGAALVLEAAPEDIEAKRDLLAALETVVGASVLIASNTSSLSITSLARGMKNPERFAGMHFFNPAPAMALVEVVRGSATAESVAAILSATAKAWGKTPVLVRDAPGFIVNRVARPFYLEALCLYENHAADPATVDAVVRDSGGFRMGPFELMDLIGHDVNAAVTRAVFEAFGRDPRFAPSRAQADLVASGRLGRKSGRGIYDHRPGAPKPAPKELPPGPKPSRVTIEGDLGPAEGLVGAIRTSGMPCARVAGEGRIVLDNAVLMLTDGRSAARRVAEDAPGDLVLFDLALDYGRAPRIGLAAGASTPTSALAAAAGFVQALGKKASPLPDAPALAVLRIVARLANEAESLVADGIADRDAVDTAMRAGANYPLGPLAWANTIGPERVGVALAALAEAEGESRYRSLVRPRDIATITQA
jgi:3-hydroxybutyryl-CoA dehydrogenase